MARRSGLARKVYILLARAVPRLLTVNSELTTRKSLFFIVSSMVSPKMPVMPPRSSYLGAIYQLSAREISPVKLRVMGCLSGSGSGFGAVSAVSAISAMGSE